MNAISQVPDFVKQLVELIVAASKEVSPDKELVVIHPDYTKPVGVQGNYARTAIYNGGSTEMVTCNCIYISHIGGEFVNIIFDRVLDRSFVRSYCTDLEMDIREGKANTGENRAGIILVSALSKLPDHVAQFIHNGVDPV